MTPRHECPSCGAQAANAVRSVVSGWTLLHCGGCQLVYLEQVPGGEQLSGDLSWTRSFALERERRRPRSTAEAWTRSTLRTVQVAMRPNRLLRLVQRFVPPNGRVLDLGCGTGHQIVAMPTTMVPVGIEVDPEAAVVSDALFKSRGGYVVRSPALPALQSLPDASFDGAIMMAYLEHETAPREILVQLRRVLKAGAPVIIKVPNYACIPRGVMRDRWCGYRFPDHVNYFTPETLQQLLQRTGYRIAWSRWADRLLPTGDNMWVVAQAGGNA